MCRSIFKGWVHVCVMLVVVMLHTRVKNLYNIVIMDSKGSKILGLFEFFLQSYIIYI